MPESLLSNLDDPAISGSVVSSSSSLSLVYSSANNSATSGSSTLKHESNSISFTGSKQPAKSGVDCLLIFNQKTQSFTLEPLHSHFNFISSARASTTAAAGSAGSFTRSAAAPDKSKTSYDCEPFY